MHDKDAERMRRFTDVPDAVLQSVRAEVLIVARRPRLVTPEHALELSRQIPGARLLVAAGRPRRLPGRGGDVAGPLPISGADGWIHRGISRR